MPRNVTITFGDGTSHVYNGVPDDAKPEDVTARAAKEFSGKSITNIDGGKEQQERPVPRVDAMGNVSYENPEDQKKFEQGEADVLKGIGAGLARNITGPASLLPRKVGDAAAKADSYLQQTGDPKAQVIGELLPFAAPAVRLGAAGVGAAGRVLAGIGEKVTAARGVESAAASQALKAEGTQGLDAAIKEAGNPIAKAKALEDFAAKKPNADILSVKEPTPAIAPEKVAQIRQAAQDAERQVAKTGAKLQEANRALAAADKYAAGKRSEFMVRSLRRQQTIAQREFDAANTAKTEAATARQQIEGQAKEARTQQTAADRMRATSEREIQSGAKSAQNTITRLQKLRAEVEAAKPEAIASKTKSIASELFKSGRLNEQQYKEMITRIDTVGGQVKDTLKARAELKSIIKSIAKYSAGGAAAAAGFEGVRHIL